MVVAFRCFVVAVCGGGFWVVCGGLWWFVAEVWFLGWFVVVVFVGVFKGL